MEEKPYQEEEPKIGITAESRRLRKRNQGIVLLLTGIGVLLISFLLASGYKQNRSLLNNIYHMEVVIAKGRYKYIPPRSRWELGKGYYEGRIAIPLKYSIVVSIVLILFGTGIILTTRENIKLRSPVNKDNHTP